MSWTDAKIQKLRELWTKGHTASQIAPYWNGYPFSLDLMTENSSIVAHGQPENTRTAQRHRR